MSYIANTEAQRGEMLAALDRLSAPDERRSGPTRYGAGGEGNL